MAEENAKVFKGRPRKKTDGETAEGRSSREAAGDVCWPIF